MGRFERSDAFETQRAPTEQADATVVRLAQAAYDERHLPAGTLDPSRLAVLADAGGGGTLGQMAFADHLASAGGIAAVLVKVNPVGDIGHDGLGEQLLGALVKDVGPRPSATAKP